MKDHTTSEAAASIASHNTQHHLMGGLYYHIPLLHQSSHNLTKTLTGPNIKQRKTSHSNSSNKQIQNLNQNILNQSKLNLNVNDSRIKIKET